MGVSSLMAVAGFDVYLRKNMCPLLLWRTKLSPPDGNYKADISSVLRKKLPYM